MSTSVNHCAVLVRAEEASAKYAQSLQMHTHGPVPHPHRPGIRARGFEEAGGIFSDRLAVEVFGPPTPGAEASKASLRP